jgi:hypothetical protein
LSAITLAFKLSTVGRGVSVEVSVGAGVEVRVRVGAGGKVDVTAGTVTARRISVEVATGSGEDEAEGPPRLQARLVRSKIVSKNNGPVFMS